MDIINILETYGTIVTVTIILKIIYFLILISRIGDIKYDIKKELNKQDELKMILIEQNKKLERIAKSLEEEQEPYIIERKESQHHAFSVNGEKENRL